MANSIDRLVVSVRDLDAAKKLYGTWLDAEPHTDTPYYVGFNVNGREVALAPAQAEPSAVVFAEVADVDEASAILVGAGATQIDAPRPAGPGQRVCVLADADGNRIGVIGA